MNVFTQFLLTRKGENVHLTPVSLKMTKQYLDHHFEAEADDNFKMEPE